MIRRSIANTGGRKTPSVDYYPLPHLQLCHSSRTLFCVPVANGIAQKFYHNVQGVRTRLRLQSSGAQELHSLAAGSPSLS